MRKMNYLKNNSNPSDYQQNINMLNSWPGLLKVLRKSSIAIRNNYLPFVFYSTIMLIVQLVVPTLVSNLGTLDFSKQVISDASSAIVGFLLCPYLNKYALNLASEKKITIRELFNISGRVYLNVYLSYILFGSLLLVGAIFIFIPLIWILPWLYLAFYPVIDMEFSPLQALKYTRTTLHNNYSKTWEIIGLNILITVVVSLLLTKHSMIAFYLNDILVIFFETSAAILYFLLKNINADLLTNQ
jgi:hypothetical protein